MNGTIYFDQITVVNHELSWTQWFSENSALLIGSSLGPILAVAGALILINVRIRAEGRTRLRGEARGLWMDLHAQYKGAIYFLVYLEEDPRLLSLYLLDPSFIRFKESLVKPEGMRQPLLTARFLDSPALADTVEAYTFALSYCAAVTSVAIQAATDKLKGSEADKEDFVRSVAGTINRLLIAIDKVRVVVAPLTEIPLEDLPWGDKQHAIDEVRKHLRSLRDNVPEDPD